MFTGEAGCFCCSDPPDPPPPCEVCEACTGDTPGDCQDRICPSFVIEVEGFANTTTQPNCAGFTATGTSCTAYNGTFVLEPTDDPCVFRSDTFLATVPVHFEFNGELCYECLNNEPVYWSLGFYGDPNFPESLFASLVIVRESDGIGFARPHTAYPSSREPGRGEIPSNICHQEPLDQWASSELHPARFVTYSAEGYYTSLISDAMQYGYAWARNGEFLGGQSFANAPGYPRIWDECDVKIQFVSSTAPGTGGKIMSPIWVCCKDESWDCDFVRDELATGNRDQQNIPYLRITSIRCGT